MDNIIIFRVLTVAANSIIKMYVKIKNHAFINMNSAIVYYCMIDDFSNILSDSDISGFNKRVFEND